MKGNTAIGNKCHLEQKVSQDLIDELPFKLEFKGLELILNFKFFRFLI